jgi:Golgi phosphoprotein 3 (GPP34)
VRLADDLFLIALDDRTGRFRLEAGALALGLGGALLAELLIAGSIAISSERVSVRPRTPPPDSLTHSIVELLAAEPQHSLRTWITYLARDAMEKTAERLVRDRHIRREETRTLLLRPGTVTYPAVDPSLVFWRSARVTQLIEERAVTEWSDCVLVGLANATGLVRLLLRDSDDAAKAYLKWLLEQLDASPGLPPLFTAITEASAARAMTNRR